MKCVAVWMFTRCSQEERNGVCAVGLGEAAREAGVRNVHAGPLGASRLAARLWSHARGEGVHGGVWEAGVEPSGRAVRGAAGECPAYQGGAGAEDGSEGQR